MTAVERTGPAPLMVLRDKLIARRTEIDSALAGSGISSERFIRTAVTCAQNQQELVSDVTFSSLWNALLKACRDRLVPDGRQGVIVPYKRQAVWIPMYRGLIDRFEASGEFKWIGAGLHRDDDIAWDFWIDEQGQHFLHRPGPGHGQIIETYACATTLKGGFFISVVSEPDMARIRAMSRARSEDSPWQQWGDQMRLKSAIRRLCKILPVPHDMDELLDDDDSNNEPNTPTPIATSRKARGATEALEQFAFTANDPQPEPESQDPGGGHAIPPDQTELEVAPIRLETAHQRGVDARAEGQKRTAMPPEYREPERHREALAWRQGWDGAANAP